ncbi:hypothetical protein EB796_014935 [Bugula neritina]|uniref:Uncharacterized protein n=1 Tax=Bugula neritina TaxID=10212 RepID=A0A7J7JL09_BUGNE|nr:hypothetical protein EB796_014935 [Bugula neritina]
MDTYLKSFRNELEELRSETVKQIIEETKAQAALYSDKPFRSTTDHRLSGSATDHQLSGSTTDHRLSGSTTATKLSGSTTGHRLSGSTTDHRLSGSATDHRLSGSTTDHRLSGSTTATKLSGSTTGHRLSGSTTDPKLSGSTTGPKLSGYTTGPKLSCSGSNKEAHSHSVVDTEYSQQMDDKTPDPKSVSSVRSSKRHRTPDTSCAKKSFIKMSPFGMTQDCDRLMNDLYNQTFSAPNQNSRIDRIPSTRLSALARADVEQQNAAAIQKPSNFQVYVDDQELQEPAAAIQMPSNFQVYVDDQELQEPAAAIQKPSNFQVYVDDQEPVSASLEPSSFKVYTDQPNPGIAPLERVVSPPHGCQQVEAVSGQQTSLHVEQHSPKVSIGRHSAFSVYSDKENLPARIPAQSTDTLQQEVTECHTEFNFSQQARLASTPFNSDAAPLSEFEFSSIKNTAAAPKFSSAARPSVDFAMTQHLSAISEHSHETYATSSTRSLTGSSRNTTGSSKSSTSSATTRVFSGLTRMRTCSDSQPTEHLTSVDGQQTSVAVVGAADEQGEHHLDIVREESGEIAAGADDMVKSDLMFQRMTPVVDTTFYQPPELTDAMLNTTVFIDPSNPFSESVQAKVLRKVDITSYENVEVRKDAMPKLKVGSQVTVSNLTVKLMSKLGALCRHY